MRAVPGLPRHLRRPAAPARHHRRPGPAGPPRAGARRAAQARRTPDRDSGPLSPAWLGGAAGAAALADHAFFQYERALQREADPTLVIDLPRAGGERAEGAAAAGGADAGSPAAAAAQAEGSGRAAAAPPPAEAAPAAVKEEGGRGARRQLEVGVEYAAGGAGGGLCFWGVFVRSAGEVRPGAGPA